MSFDPSSTPKLWFKRVVLIKSIQPLAVIREVKLHRGLNIIVGKSSRDAALVNNLMAMAGHSVGKTTFCRLLRYCLGEQHFSTESGEQRLRMSLPYSWVGAELEIEGTPWAVLRPLGAQKAQSSAQQESTIEEIIFADEKVSGYFEFRQELDKMLPSHVHHPEITYKWEHLLSWLARDQECRLRKFEVWRDSDSDSDSPGFRKLKKHPIHLVRGMLDLLAPEESEWSHALSDLVARQKNLEDQQHIVEQEADYFYNAASRRLAEFIGEFPDTRVDPMHRLDGPHMRVDALKSKLNAQYKGLEKQLEETERNLFTEQRYVANAQERKRQIDAHRALTPPAPQPVTVKPKTEYEEKKEKLEELTAQVDSGGECNIVGLLLSKCDHLAAYMKDLEQVERVISLPAEQRKRVFAQMDVQRRERIQAIIKQQEEAEATLQEALRRAAFYEDERKGTLKKLSALEGEMERLNRAMQDFQHAEKLGAGGVKGTQIQQYHEDLEKIDSEIHYAKNQLGFYQAQSAQKDQGLQKLYDEIVRRVLKADYSGSIITSAENFTPQIRQGNAITGAAVESLSFVLLDIASMLAASRGMGHHPGFLVHDSPREADLDIGPYHSLFTELAAITNETGGKNMAPFQYIITTTTEPPADLDDLIRLSLAAHPEKMMLFGQRLEDKGTLIMNESV